MASANSSAFGVGLLGSINNGMAADADNARNLKLYEDKKNFDALQTAKSEDEANQRAATEHTNKATELARLINMGDDPDPASLAVASPIISANGGKYNMEDIPAYQQAAQQVRARLWAKKTGQQTQQVSAQPTQAVPNANVGSAPVSPAAPDNGAAPVNETALQPPAGQDQGMFMNMPSKQDKSFELHKKEKVYDMGLEQQQQDAAAQRTQVPTPATEWDYSKGVNQPYLAQLKKSDPQLAQDADALTSGLQEYPTYNALAREENKNSDKRWTRALAAARYIDPDYSEQTARTMRNTIDDFSKSSSKDYQSVQAGNTIATHLKLLQDAAPALENGDLQAWNHVANSIGAQTGKSPQAVFGAVNEKLAEELARLYIGGVPSDADIARQKTNLAQYSSPTQIRDVTKELVELAGGKMKSLEYDYKTGLGRAGSRARDIFTPEARDTFFPKQAPGVPVAGQASAPPQVPQAGQQQQAPNTQQQQPQQDQNQQQQAASQQNSQPLIVDVKSQEDIDNAPPGALIRYNGHLVGKAPPKQQQQQQPNG